VNVRQTWLSRRAIGLHVVIIVIIPTFAALCDWQVHRALAGNELSWAYVFEWPFFAGYAIYMWWRILHEAPAGAVASADPGPGDPRATGPAGPSGPAAESGSDAESDAETEERDAYNRYLAELATRGRRKQWR
jgi:hypothetical protein